MGGETLPLFDEPARPAELRDRLRPKLVELAAHNIFVGTSSWKYEGWFNQIYSRDRYLTRGKFSPRRFAAECLAEYAETFPIVCGDFSFYQFPLPEFWTKLFHSAPNALLYAFKAPEEITVKQFPKQPRYGPRAGTDNGTFLDAALFRTAFLDALTPYQSQVAVIILEFGAFPRWVYEHVVDFIAELDPFLASLPDGWRFAVEIRNPEFLGPEYFACLHHHGVAHVFNAWTRMPEVSEQMLLPGAFTADFTVTRALLRKGRPYEQAVEKFSPYTEVQDPNPALRSALRQQIERARRLAHPAYIFANNRLEGSAPGTIEAIVD